MNSKKLLPQMRPNKSFHAIDTAEPSHATALLHFDLPRLYRRIKSKDLLVYVL